MKDRSKAAKVAVQKVSPVCCDIKVELPTTGYKKWEQWVLATSCRHWEHPDSDLKAQEAHLNEAADRKAIVCDIGDFLCLMQTPGDKRSGVGGSGVREEHNPKITGQGYIDGVLSDFRKWVKPWYGMFAFVGSGNHETAFYRKAGWDISPVVANACGAVPMGYRGYARFLFKRGAWQTSRTMYFDHGSGGASEMTVGTGKTRRRAAVVPDADIILTGHLHQSFELPVTRCRLRKDGTEVAEEQVHVQLGTYKDDITGKPHGWAIEKGMAPPSKRQAWLRFSLNENEAIRLDVLPATV